MYFWEFREIIIFWLVVFNDQAPLSTQNSVLSRTFLIFKQTWESQVNYGNVNTINTSEFQAIWSDVKHMPSAEER